VLEKPPRFGLLPTLALGRELGFTWKCAIDLLLKIPFFVKLEFGKRVLKTRLVRTPSDGHSIRVRMSLSAAVSLSGSGNSHGHTEFRGVFNGNCMAFLRQCNQKNRHTIGQKGDGKRHDGYYLGAWKLRMSAVYNEG
jgi:hypothetical protein